MWVVYEVVRREMRVVRREMRVVRWEMRVVRREEGMRVVRRWNEQ